MSLIVWDDSFSVNVTELDAQHKKLVAMLNELHNAMKAGHGKGALGSILNGLISYTDSHFKTEETYFARFNYPEAANHKKEHVAFVEKALRFKDDFEQNRLTVSIELLQFLSDWLQGHIKGSDKKYGRFFNENGVR